MSTTPPDLVTAFRVDIPQADLDDLQRRLTATRWPDELPGAGWEYGIPLARVRSLVERWQGGYDWRTHEAELNAIPQFTTEIDGQRIHFLHVRSAEDGALPLILTHGWPGSVLEFARLIGPLTDPTAHGGHAEDAFDVVVPSLPGFGFSGPTTERGWTPRRVAGAWASLMDRLGYSRYGAQGGDLGSRISRELGRIAADVVVGVHVNFLLTPPAGDPATFTEEERRTQERLARFNREGSGYFGIHATRPQTLAFALNDSPTGLLAWIAEKFTEWSDPDRTIDDDDILTDVMLYWLTGTAASSMRMYWEFGHTTSDDLTQRSATPTGIAVFPHEIAPPLRAIVERTENVVHWSTQPAGGHFAALEQPALLIDDIRTFFRPLRRTGG
jgi:pimeloyl-ACP methyl ester carboxylesterase